MNEVQTFVLEDSGIRGALVRLEETWQQVIAAHEYPPAIRTLSPPPPVFDSTPFRSEFHAP